MATYEKKGRMTYKDENGDLYILYPATKKECVEGITEIEDQISQLSSEKATKTSLTLGVHTDGLVYIFVDGKPVGTGIELPSGGGISGYVDSENNIIINGLSDGTYTVKYEMEDGTTVEIGELVLDSNTYYSVTNNLTNCASSNSATQVAEGEGYSASIAVNSGYELSSVTVTMGGVDVTGDVWVSTTNIYIASVTGDVVITAVAEEKAGEAEPTNFFNVSGDGFVDGGRIGSDGGNRTDGGPDCLISNYIAVQSGDVVFIENADVYSNLNSGLYDMDKAKMSVFTSSGSSDVTANDTTSGQQQFTMVNANVAYARFTLKPSASIKVNASGANAAARYDLSQIVVKIKRNGEWL